MVAKPAGPDAALRLDKWLWLVRLFKTRALAQQHIAGHRLRINGRVVEKPSAAVRPGDTVTIPWQGTIRVLRVRELPARRGPAAEARATYDDLTLPA